MKNKLLLSLMLGIIMISLIGIASASLGTFKQNQPVDIRVLGNCSTINLTEVNDGTTTYKINSPMTHIGGQTFNYTFTNTNRLGTYTYSWNNPCVDCASNECGNSFEVTPSGFIGTLGFYIVILIIISLIIILGFSIKEEWFVILGGMGLMMFGIYSINYGVVGFRDMFMTWGIGLFEIAVGTILSVGSAFQMVADD
jgi:hypothetical protein